MIMLSCAMQLLLYTNDIFMFVKRAHAVQDRRIDGRERVMVVDVGFFVGIRCQRVLKSVWCNITQRLFLF